jgi:hypothetical protein
MIFLSERWIFPRQTVLSLTALRRATLSKEHPGIWRLFLDVVDSTAWFICEWAVEGVGERELQRAEKGRGVRSRPL